MADSGDISDSSNDHSTPDTDHSTPDTDHYDDDKTNTTAYCFSACQLQKQNNDDFLKSIYKDHNYHRQSGLDSQDNLYSVYKIQGDRGGKNNAENTEQNEDNSMISHEYSDESRDYTIQSAIEYNDHIDGNTKDGNDVIGADNNINDMRPNRLLRLWRQINMFGAYVLHSFQMPKEKPDDKNDENKKQ